MEEEIYTRLRDSTTASYSKLSWFIVFKTTKGFRYEVVTKIPDPESLQNTDGQFSGQITIEDINGDFIEGYIYENGSFKVVARNDGNKRTAGEIICTQRDWYTCVSAGGYFYGCNYNYSDPVECIEKQDEYHDKFTVVDGSWYPNLGGCYGCGGGSTINTAKPSAALAKITKTSNLSGAQIKKLNQILAQYLNNCLSQATYDYVTQRGIKYNFIMDPSSGSPASYNYNNNNLKFKDDAAISVEGLAEEMFHSMQNLYYPGGLGGFTNSGRSNIEFEAKVMKDIIAIMNGQPCCMTVGSNNTLNTNYYLWIQEITNWGTKYPNSFNVMQSKYFQFLGNFKSAFPEYNYPTTAQQPTALLKAIANSKCTK